MMKSIARRIFKSIFSHYKREYGKHTILTKLYFPFIAPSQNHKEKVRLYNQTYITVKPAEYLQAFLYTFGGYEFPSLRFIEKLLQPGMTVLDIGAQIGFMSLVFGNAVGKSGKVYSFEPESVNFQALQENIRLNDFSHIYPNNVAVTEHNTTIKLFIGKGENTGVHSTLFNERTLSQQFVEVPGVSIDSFVSAHNLAKIDFVKLDIEGAELPAIRGMRALIERDKPILLVELAAELQNLAGLSIKQFKQALLDEFDYLSYTIYEDGMLKPSEVSEFHLGDNVVFAHKTDTIIHTFLRTK